MYLQHYRTHYMFHWHLMKVSFAPHLRQRVSPVLDTIPSCYKTQGLLTCQGTSFLYTSQSAHRPRGVLFSLLTPCQLNHLLTSPSECFTGVTTSHSDHWNQFQRLGISYLATLWDERNTSSFVSLLHHLVDFASMYIY